MLENKVKYSTAKLAMKKPPAADPADRPNKPEVLASETVKALLLWLSDRKRINMDGRNAMLNAEQIKIAKKIARERKTTFAFKKMKAIGRKASVKAVDNIKPLIKISAVFLFATLPPI